MPITTPIRTRAGRAAVLVIAGGLLALGGGTAFAGSPAPAPSDVPRTGQSAVPRTAPSPVPSVAPRDGAELRRCLRAAASGTPAPGCERYAAEIDQLTKRRAAQRPVPRATPAPAVVGDPRFTG